MSQTPYEHQTPHDPAGHDPAGHDPAGHDPTPTAPYPASTPAAPYGQAPYGQAPHGQAPHGQAPYGQAPHGQAPHGTGTAFGPDPGATPAPRRRGRLAAAVVAASLLVGGGAGVGGAALWDAQHPDPSGSRAGTQVVQAAPAKVATGSIEEVAQDVLPSVVKIDVRTAQGAGSGSGIILTADGQILTNDHVVDGAEGGELTVSFSDGSTAPATVVGTDPLTDIAVIQADGVSGLTPAAIGSSGALLVGQPVVAIGSPFGLDATVTSGIVSALDRPVNVQTDEDGNATTYPAIQTDAAINPGNSGGPLVDMNGAVVGINSSIRTAGSSSMGEASGSIGLGFAIGIDEVLPIVDQLKAGEPATHARLGITVGDAAPDAGVAGAALQSVTDGGAAEQAGLRQGDVITRIDDTQITGADSLVATIRAHRPGDTVTIEYTRGGSAETVQVELESDAQATDG